MRSGRVPLSPRRVGIARVLMLLPFAILLVRAAHLSVDERGRELGRDQTRRTLELAPARGAIFDATGAELALTIEAPSIYAVPSEMDDIAAAALELGAALDRDPQPLKERLEDHRSFLFLARWVSDDLARRVLELGLPGVGVLTEPRRTYPNGQLAGQLVGFTNIDGEGVRGLEKQEDDWLRGIARRIPVERDARGRLLWLGGRDQWSTAGGDIALTIDAALQAQAEAVLAASVARSGARGGVVVVVAPDSGDILTLAEAPGFDPNHFRTLPFAETRSTAFLDAVDPGSTLKAFLVAAALETGALDPDDVIDCENGSFRVPGKTIRDTRPHGLLTPGDILQVSSNIGAVKIGYALGPSAHYEMLRRFGFGSSTQSEFPGESAGLLRPWKSWRPVDHATIAFGQGINVTPVQLAAATAALGNGGRWVQPGLVAAKRAPGGRWHRTRARPSHRVVSEQTARTVLDMLEAVVSPQGTARRAALRGIRVAGKTGTAQKYDPESGSFATDRFDSWFIGVVPADDPKLAIAVVVEEPERPYHTGGATAAPLFAEVAAAQLTRFGIFTEPLLRPAATPDVRLASASPEEHLPAAPAPSANATSPVSPLHDPAPGRHAVPDDVPDAPGAAGFRSASEPLTRLGDRILLPDFHGLTIAQVQSLAHASALAIELRGRGRAVSQDPPPGSVIALSDGPVHVRFEAAGRSPTGGEG